MVSGCLNKQHSTGLCDGRRWSSQWKIRSTKSMGEIHRPQGFLHCSWREWPLTKLWMMILNGSGSREVVMWKDVKGPKSDDFFAIYFGGTMSEGRLLLRWLAWWVRGTCQNFFQSLGIKCFGHFYFMSRTSCYSYSSMTICNPASRLNSFHQFPVGVGNLHLGSVAGDEVRV